MVNSLERFIRLGAVKLLVTPSGSFKVELHLIHSLFAVTFVL